MTHTTTRELVLELAEAIDADDWEEARRLCHELELVEGPRPSARSLATLFRTLGVLASDMVARAEAWERVEVRRLANLVPRPVFAGNEPDVVVVETGGNEDELEDQDELEDEERRQQLLRWSGR